MTPPRQSAAPSPIRPHRLAFAIPLRPRDAFVDWEQAQVNLRRTVRSIRSATGGEGAVIAVGCHEPPDLGELASGVELLSAPFPASSAEQLEGSRDRVWKQRLAAAWLREQLAGDDVYVMSLDADDLIHRDLLAHVFRHGQERYLVEQGYVLDTSSGVLWRHRAEFHRICGSSLIRAFRSDELPSSWDDDSSPFAQFAVGSDRMGHPEVSRADTELDQQAARVPFPAVVSLANPAERRSSSHTADGRHAPFAPNLVWPRPARRILQEEFGAPDLAAETASVPRTAAGMCRAAVGRTVGGVVRRRSPGRHEDPAAGRTSRARRLISTEAIRDDLSTGGLREKVRSGLGWKLATFLFGQGTRTFVAILLAHLLLPEDFGLAGMAIAFSGLAAVFSDLGLGRALIQRETLSEQDRSTVFWINVGGGAALTLLGIALSPAVAAFFSDSRVMPLFAALSCSFVIASFGQTQAALLTREMSFRSLEVRTITATLVGAAAAISLALAGFGPWAIIAQVLCTSAASTLMLWTVSPWRPRLAFSRDSFRTLGSFGSKLLVIRGLSYVNQNGDNLLIGRYIGTVALGVYAVAYNVMLLPIIRITAPVRDVIYAALVRLQNEPHRMGEVWLRVNSLTASLVVPAFIGLAVVAPDFVPVVLGRRWDAAIPVLQFLSIGGAATSLQSFNGQVYQALGIPGLFVRFMFFSTGVTFSAFVVGLHWGVTGVAASYAAARTITLIAITIQTSRLVALGPWRVLRSFLDILWRTGAMAAAVLLGRLALIDVGLPVALRLVVLTIGGTVFYCALTLLAAPELVRDLRSGLRGRVPATT